MELQVVEHRLADGDTVELEPAARVVYHVDRNEAEHHEGPFSLSGPAHALSFELVSAHTSGALLSAPVELLTRSLHRDQLVRLLGGQLAWAAILLATALALWRAGVRRFEAVGG